MDNRLPKLTKLPTVAFSPRSKRQAEAKRLCDSLNLVFLVGEAGTAKTTIAAAQAVEDVASGRATKIVICRPAVEAGESIGYLPGTKNEKMFEWAKPMLGALARFWSKSIVTQLLSLGVIECESLTYLRGSSLENTVILLEEFQNATPAQAKLALTRIGEGTRCIVTGDPQQIDLANDVKSALEDLERFNEHPEIGLYFFGREDVTRSRMCQIVLDCYDKRKA